MPRAHVLPDGRQIAELRGEADLTQWQLAAEAGYGLRTIGKIEDGQPTGAGTLSAVATVLARRLKRPIGLTDLIRRPNGDGGCCLCRPAAPPAVVAEGLKLLDLTAWRPGPGGDRVVLNDLYRFRATAGVGALHFHYATAGPRADGRCLSHANSQWRPVEWSAADERHLHAAYQMCVRLDRHEGGPAVHNRIEYVDAFSGPEREWFHTHVVFPTESLTLLALFPDGKRCREVRGLVKRHPAAAFETAVEGPVVLMDGRVAFWHLVAPEQGGTYQLEWQW